LSQRTVVRQEDTHFRVLRLLQDSPHITQRELSDELGISLCKVNYCLKALLDKGLIKIQRFRKSDSKLPYIYLLTPSGITEKATISARFLRRKMEEYEQLKSEIELLQREVSQARPAQKAKGVEMKLEGKSS
jgi:EPS-associated MarR family transcriptional regulator